MQLIPAIDLMNERVVRLRQGDFGRCEVYPDSPQTVLRRYQRAGARLVHVVDLDAARTGEFHHHDCIRALGAEGVALQVGGGVRSRERVWAYLNAGVSRVVIGSLAVSDPQLTQAILDEVGLERVVLALDVRMVESTPMLTVSGWQQATQISMWDLLSSYPRVRHVLCTDVDRDGLMQGPNLELYQAAQTRFGQIAWQASGGVSSVSDLHALAALNVSAAISGKALLDRAIALEEIGSF